MKKKLVKVCEDWYGNIYPYFVKTSRAKHPIHMIEGGDYLTEDMSEFNPAGDMGVFGLNQKDYEWFKSHLVEVELEVE